MTLVTKQNVYVLVVLMGPSGIEEGGELVGASSGCKILLSPNRNLCCRMATNYFERR